MSWLAAGNRPEFPATAHTAATSRQAAAEVATSPGSGETREHGGAEPDRAHGEAAPSPDTRGQRGHGEVTLPRSEAGGCDPREK